MRRQGTWIAGCMLLAGLLVAGRAPAQLRGLTTAVPGELHRIVIQIDQWPVFTVDETGATGSAQVTYDPATRMLELHDLRVEAASTLHSNGVSRLLLGTEPGGG